MTYETRFLCALAVTVAAETAAIGAALRLVPHLKRLKVSIAHMVAAGTIPSIATLPYFWFVLPAFVETHLWRIIIGETAIFAAETVILRLLINIPIRSCALLSLLANCASIIAGMIVFH